MPHYTEYRCSECKRETERSLLTVKKVAFAEMGAGARQLRSRVVAWLCDECLPKDPDYKKAPFVGAPGMQSAPLERVRAKRSRGES